MSKMEFLINVHAQFLHKHSGKALFGHDYSIRLFDQDPISDDFLGETKPDNEGKVQFKIDPALYRSEDSPLEKRPDFYLVVLKDSVEIFRTPVALNVNVDDEGNFNFTDGEWVDLGTFIIDNGELRMEN